MANWDYWTKWRPWINSGGIWNDGVFMWGIQLLAQDAYLHDFDKPCLARNAAELVCQNETMRHILDDPRVKGVIEARNKYQMFNNYPIGGLRYDAQLETPCGKVNVAFLLTKIECLDVV